MKYYATKNSIQKEINKNMIKNYLQLGWSVKNEDNENITLANYDSFFPFEYEISQTLSNDPYDYNSVSENKLQPVIIGYESFTNYSSYLCVNTKTYVTQPERTTDGSMPDINDIETFSVPRFKIKFDKMSISDFRRMLSQLDANEFTVTYYDYEKDQIVTQMMYIEPREMAELYNIGYEILDVLGVEFSFIATLNETQTYLVGYYYNNGSNAVVTSMATEQIPYGQRIRIKTFDEVKGIDALNVFSVPSGKHFKCWNTKRNEKGDTFMPNQQVIVTREIKMVAIWES